MELQALTQAARSYALLLGEVGEVEACFVVWLVVSEWAQCMCVQGYFSEHFWQIKLWIKAVCYRAWGGKENGTTLHYYTVVPLVSASTCHPLSVFLPHSLTAVSSAWLSPLLSAIPHLPKDVLRREVLNIAVANAQLSQTVNSRKASCQMIGKMAPKFESYWWVH